MNAKSLLPALLLVLMVLAPHKSAAQDGSFDVKTSPHYFDANKLAFAPRKTALALLRASKLWDSIVPSDDGFEVSARNVTWTVVIEKGRVVALNLMLLSQPPVHESLITILDIPPRRFSPQRYPTGMRWTDPRGRFKYIDIMRLPGGSTMIAVDFLSANPPYDNPR